MPYTRAGPYFAGSLTALLFHFAAEAKKVWHTLFMHNIDFNVC